MNYISDFDVIRQLLQNAHTSVTVTDFDIECEFWEATPEEIHRGNKVNTPCENIPYWKNVCRPTVDKRVFRAYHEWE